MATPIVQVDAFTDRAFAGNPAAVCVLSSARDESWMQHVAREMNLSETAFVRPREDGFDLRWFTPATEVDLCGHATLAAAHVLWQDGHAPASAAITFYTNSGPLIAEQEDDGIRLDFPAEPAVRCQAPAGLIEALAVPPVYVGKNRFDYLVQVDSAAEVRHLEPDMTALKTVDARGIIVTSPADVDDYDFVSRFFAPGAGVDEDPVTGSAHCCLGPYWAERLDRNELDAYQASPRGGVLQVRVAGERVHLIGRSVTVLRGEIIS